MTTKSSSSIQSAAAASGDRGFDRRRLIRGGAMAAAGAWVAPAILSSPAGATVCTPVPCTVFYGAKWQAPEDELCDGTPPCENLGAAGDPACTDPGPFGPGQTIVGGCGTGVSVTCSGNDFLITVPEGCHLVRVSAKRGNVCFPVDFKDECTRSTVVAGGGGLSHFTAFWCCG